MKNMGSKKNGSLDTNTLLRLLLGDIPEQTKAVEKLLTTGRKFEVADAALIEMVFVLEKIYKMDRNLIQENILGIVRNSVFACNKALFENALPIYVSESSLSIIDCSLLTYARLNKALPLYSFDKKLVNKSNNDCVNP